LNQLSNMDFITKQSKLTKEEWANIEIPCSDSEKRILALIADGYNEVNISRNYTASLVQHMKLTNPEQFDDYIYTHYFKAKLEELYQKHGLAPPLEVSSKKKKIVLKKADIIRIENTSKHIDTNIFEFMLLELLEKLLERKAGKAGKKSSKQSSSSSNSKTAPEGKDKEWLFYLFTLQKLLKYKIAHVNIELSRQLTVLLQSFVAEFAENALMRLLVEQSYELIEKNDYLLRYADETLYDHQKQLFTICKQPQPKLILYIAPTGTGKTMSPLGLATAHKVIFVCAARHVGLSLAKAAISIQKKIAFAFGCRDAEDIRLHYYAAKEYTKHSKSGGIGKVDNSQGEKVEIMICDVQSYLPAMLYMLAFNPKENIITYWDEPTITMDYPEHELHALIHKNWTENLIPNLVLSSATLPQQREISETIMDFCARFAGVQVHEIISYDCKKTIPLINRDGYVEMPHYLHDDYVQIQQVVEHCKQYKTLLRYIDLREAIRFIRLTSAELMQNDRYTIENYFPDMDALDMTSLKLFYLEVLGNVQPAAYPNIYAALISTRQKIHESNVNVTTSDAYTLTDGPTIFLADDINKIAQFYIQNAKIPEYVTKEIMEKIQFNRQLHGQIKEMEKDLEDAIEAKSTSSSESSKKEKNNGDDRLSPEMKAKKQKLSVLQESMKTISLNPTYVPNTRDHLYKYAARMNHANVFTCQISEDNVEQIMRTEVQDYWKLLLLMGIGVFSAHKCVRYTEIMKKLAQEHKLFMIIASTDYIYGTNYQFCHGYIGNDLAEMSQEKCIQTMGRVGRNKLQQDYSVRFRSNGLLYKLFHTEENKPEVLNMNRLFCQPL
jgi:hypothetical protein